METVDKEGKNKESLQEVIKISSPVKKKAPAYYLLPPGDDDYKELKISFTRIQYGKKEFK